jgi:ribosomal protein S8
MNPLTKALVEIKNAQIAGKDEVVIRPTSKLLVSVLDVIKECGYVRDFELLDDHRGGIAVVRLNGRINNCGVVSPRFSVKLEEMEKFEARYLPAKNFGRLILTTVEGIMTNEDAKQKHVGGKLLAYIY